MDANQSIRTPDPRSFSLDAWMRLQGSCAGTFTFNGVVYHDAHEVEWRIANNVWLARDTKQ